MTFTTLPPWDEIQQVHAVDSLALLAALGTCKLNLHHGKEGEPGGLVPEADEAGVEVDLRCQSRDPDEGGCTNDHQRSHGLVEEARIDVRSFFQDDNVSPGPLGGSHLCVCVSFEKKK